MDFQPICPKHRLLRRSAWGIFIAIGLCYLATSILGEIFFSAIPRQSNVNAGFGLATLASRIFPLERRYRKQPVQLLISIVNAFGNPPELVKPTITAIQDELKRDPNSPDLLAFLINFQLLINDDAAAKVTYKKFQQVARASPLSRILEQKPVLSP